MTKGRAPYVLRAFGDYHPQNVLDNLIDVLHIPKDVQRGIYDDHIAAWHNDPSILAQREYWNGLAKKLIVSGEGVEAKLPAGCRSEKATPVDVRVCMHLAGCHAMYVAHYVTIDGIRPRMLYMEGDGDSPTTLYAKAAGAELCLLDEGDFNFLYNGTGTGNEKLIDLFRMVKWAQTKFQPSPAINRSLLIAGEDHVDNKDMLRAMLVKKGISLVKILSGEKIAVPRIRAIKEAWKKKGIRPQGI